MNTTELKISDDHPTLAQFVAELKKCLSRLREQYKKAQAQNEFGPDYSVTVETQGKTAQRQLTLLVPVYRALNALAQQGGKPSPRAVAAYIAGLTKVLALVDCMVTWADGSEIHYAELLSLRLPDFSKGSLASGVTLPLGDRLNRQRDALQAAKAAVTSLVSRFVKSFSATQKAMLEEYFKLSRNMPLRLTPNMLLELGHA